MIKQDQNQTKTNEMVVDKYDRQIRLWGSRGQRALGLSKVALVKCTGPGIQALKNLVLPGVGTIDIWDQTDIKIQDLSTSFFYQHDDVGKLKAEVASRNLLQMNPDSKGSFYKKNLSQFLNDQSSIQSYNLVIFGGEMSQQQYRRSSQKLWKLNIPCIFITISGYFFYVRLQKQTHFVQSSNSLQKKYYLRLADPFPSLAQHARSDNVYTALERVQGKKVEDCPNDFSYFANIPSSLVLISVLQKMPEDKKRIFPEIRKQLNDIIDRVNQNYRQNIREAVSRAFLATQQASDYMIDIGLLSCKHVKQCNKDSHIFFKFLYATNQFYEETKKLPQPAVLPDMTTTTQRYIKLRHIYKAKHQQDLKSIIQKIKSRFGDQNVDQKIISDYINNLNNLELVQMKPYHEQMDNPDLISYYQNEKDLLIAIRAFQKHADQLRNGTIQYQRFRDSAQSLKNTYNISQYDQRYLKQAFRSKGLTNINIISIAGAMVGQEAIKLLTGCFTPINGGYLFDGANGQGFQVKL